MSRCQTQQLHHHIIVTPETFLAANYEGQPLLLPLLQSPAILSPAGCLETGSPGPRSQRCRERMRRRRRKVETSMQREERNDLTGNLLPPLLILISPRLYLTHIKPNPKCQYKRTLQITAHQSGKSHKTVSK